MVDSGIYIQVFPSVKRGHKMSNGDSRRLLAHQCARSDLERMCFVVPSVTTVALFYKNPVGYTFKL